MKIKPLIKDIQKLEKKEKKKLKGLILSFLSNYRSLTQLSFHLNELSDEIQDQVYDINELAIGLANKHSDINNKAKVNSAKENLMIAAASMNLARKSANYTLLSDDYSKSIKDVKKNIDSDVELLVATQIFTKFNEQLLNNNSKTKYRWDAQLDIRTCAKCSELNGNIYDSIDEVPSIPVHPRCRCIAVPLD